MSLPHWSVRRRISVVMILLVVVLFGLLSIPKLGLDLLPDLEFPFVTVLTTYEGVAPEEIESLVTRPIEEFASTVRGVKRVMSTSKEGISLVMVEFEWGCNLDFAAQDIRAKLSQAKAFLPDEADDPTVLKFNASDIPIIFFGITGLEDTLRLRTLVKDRLKTSFERVEGVASAFLLGGREREIQILVDGDRLAGHGLSLEELAQALGRENLDLMGGHLRQGGRELLVTTQGEFENLEELRRTVVGQRNGQVIELRHVARVLDRFKEERSHARVNRKDAVIMAVMKEAGANTVTTVSRLKERLAECRRLLPPEVEIHCLMDQADFISRAISRSAWDAVAGGMLAILIIWLFLRSWRATLTIGLAIPLSVLTAFIGMRAVGYTFNVMTLGGLALGVGMLVDNAIVVIENVFRRLQAGESPSRAAAEGARQVGGAIVAATLTTVAAFLPLILSEGLAGKLARPLALTVCISLLASLFVALTLVPMLCATLLRASSPSSVRAFESGKDELHGRYGRSLSWALDHPRTVVFGALAAALASLALVPGLGAEFMPRQDIPIAMILGRLAVGTSLDETDGIMRRVEDAAMADPDVLVVGCYVGLSEMSKFDSAAGMGAADVNESQLFFTLTEKSLRRRSSDQVADGLRSSLPRLAGAEFLFMDMTQAMNGGTNDQTPIVINVFGNELPRIEAHARQVAALCRQVPGLKDVQVNSKPGKPELALKVDRRKAARLGVSLRSVARSLRAALLGTVVGRYRHQGEEIDMRLRLEERDRKDEAALLRLPVATADGGILPLSQLASFVVDRGPGQIHRENQQRKVSVNANYGGSSLEGVVHEIRRRMAKLPTPPGLFVDYGGTYKDMKAAQRSLLEALFVALLLVYMVMAAQFESLLQPFIILFAIPLGIVGVVGGLCLLGKSLSVPAFMGSVILCGIAVNNAIVMIDLINQLRDEGRPRREAVLRGASIRLRPILVTSLTTILGMLPLAFGQGEGAELRSPLGVAVAFGLLSSTILVLFVVPAVYMLLDRRRLSGDGLEKKDDGELRPE